MPSILSDKWPKVAENSGRPRNCKEARVPRTVRWGECGRSKVRSRGTMKNFVGMWRILYFILRVKERQ